jgi:hypothetical protein
MLHTALQCTADESFNIQCHRNEIKQYKPSDEEPNKVQIGVSLDNK